MRSTNEIFTSEVVGGDWNALDRVYTADARILPPGAEMISGRPAIKAFWRDAVPAMGVKSATLASVETYLAGDGIVEIGRAELTLDASTMTAKYVVFWKREEGRWKWHVDIWNPNS